MSSTVKWIRILGTLALLPAALIAQPAESAKTWVGRAAVIEEYIRTAPIVRFEDVSRGVTRPRRGYLAPGGPVESIVWKALRPGMSRGFYESYKSEIAAYEIDKLLALDMVPPKVERRAGGRRRCGRHVGRSHEELRRSRRRAEAAAGAGGRRGTGS